MLKHVPGNLKKKKMVQMNIFRKLKQTHKHRKQTMVCYGYQRGKGWVRDKLGVGDLTDIHLFSC